MINSFKNEKVAVLGLGLEGKDVVKFILKQGASVTVFDKKEEKDLDLTGIERKKINLVCGGSYLSGGIGGFETIFRSPGIYRYLPELVKAEKEGIEISSATKLFFDLCPGKIIGVTGTKGKGTTCTLIYEILKKAGKDVYLAGNIGKPYLELLPKLNKTSLVVLELSSFQLIDLQKSPHLSVVLNVTVDHLDWHKDEKEYLQAKTSIVRYQRNTDYVVINADYKKSVKFGDLTSARVFYFSRRKKVEGAYVDQGRIILNVDRTREIGETKKLLLRGEHNWENITAAICASYLAGSDLGSIKRVVFSFRGLEHRLEFVRKVKGVSFYNDSFATGPQPVMAAIDSFYEPTTLILGGFDKGLTYGDLAKKAAGCKNIKTIILIGDIGSKIGDELKKAKFPGLVINLGKPPMEEIVREAFSHTPNGGVVLLSPGSSSFDMFKDYKDRGNQFKKATRNL